MNTIASPQKRTKTKAIWLRKSQLRKKEKQPATIEGYVKRILAAVNWGYRSDRLSYSFKGKKRDSEIRSRPNTVEELDRIINQVPTIRPNDHPLWAFYIKGLFWSGLRRAESVRLGWDWSFDFSVDISSSCPYFNVRGEGQKSGKDKLLPMAPEFAEECSWSVTTRAGF